MNKQVIIGIVAFGGLMLVGAILSGNKNQDVALGENESSIEETASLPANFPAVPIYPNSEIKNLRQTDGETAEDFSLSLSAEATITEVNEWYRTELGQNGWIIKSDRNVAGYQIIQSEKGNLYTSMQTANSEEAGWVNISQSVKIRK